MELTLWGDTLLYRKSSLIDKELCVQLCSTQNNWVLVYFRTCRYNEKRNNVSYKMTSTPITCRFQLNKDSSLFQKVLPRKGSSSMICLGCRSEEVRHRDSPQMCPQICALITCSCPFTHMVYKYLHTHGYGWICYSQS